MLFYTYSDESKWVFAGVEKLNSKEKRLQRNWKLIVWWSTRVQTWNGVLRVFWCNNATSHRKTCAPNIFLELYDFNLQTFFSTLIGFPFAHAKQNEKHGQTQWIIFTKCLRLLRTKKMDYCWWKNRTEQNVFNPSFTCQNNNKQNQSRKMVKPTIHRLNLSARRYTANFFLRGKIQNSFPIKTKMCSKKTIEWLLILEKTLTL